MKKIPLGSSGIEVTDWCLGTMTYGNQTGEADAHAQIDMALDAGIDFMDCAEIYPVNPVRSETVGVSEQVLGNWFAKSGKRDQWKLATKISGMKGEMILREGKGYDGAVLRQCVDDSLRRLQTDYIDLYQLHVPMRGTYAFRRNWGFDPSAQNKAETEAFMLDILEAMDDVIKAGKVRAFGLSNESCWGTSQWLKLSDMHGLPRVASVQNEYSLLCRLWDTDMAEMSVNEDVLLLSYSPLGAGLLTGKYQNGGLPEGSRMAINGDLGGRKSDRVFDAVDAYLAIAEKHGLDPLHMALAWQKTRPFPICAIFGATSTEQLERTLAGYDVTLSDEVIAEIEAAHKAHPMPF
ncbi:aldo/keto reductase [Pelagovum pacificum]|uniref:Aldo/keto reductase n=1 Tax=Pelagovum pacificum TaxID=2588711 RepID=A0A5C5GEM6_9RHOB|nr:aldo/keto reductase [Pelagovum pacificum]QQA43643.1 aldo/keto reductase [Pelagovum pacificum]TNY33222.1 aldo/keto reductase [Pelagovum pacificum]